MSLEQAIRNMLRSKFDFAANYNFMYAMAVPLAKMVDKEIEDPVAFAEALFQEVKTLPEVHPAFTKEESVFIAFLRNFNYNDLLHIFTEAVRSILNKQ